MLGPSGSGKTTMLRLIAGFELPTAGTIELDGRDVSRDPPFDRDVNTVFQDYALFPHMDVAKNVEYGLKVKKVREARARARRVEEALASVRLEGSPPASPTSSPVASASESPSPGPSSTDPSVLLLDEPLGALDRKLREEMQVELKQIQQQVGITFIFVTHDQGEALSMSDRVAVFHEGKVEQVGPPREIYEHPATEFVAGFVGTANLLADGDGLVTVRPERIRFGGAGRRRDRCRRHRRRRAVPRRRPPATGCRPTTARRSSSRCPTRRVGARPPWATPCSWPGVTTIDSPWARAST